MKYLKLFESSNFYYERIEYDEFDEELKSSSISMDKLYFSKMESIINDKKNQIYLPYIIVPKFSIKLQRIQNHGYLIEYCSISPHMELIKSKQLDTFIEIYQCEDEWFLIRIKENNSKSGWSHDYKAVVFYKCDQWEGVLKCLKNILLLKIK